MPKSDDKPQKVRPQILVESVTAARKIVSEKYGAALANSLSDGDVVDLAFQIITTK